MSMISEINYGRTESITSILNLLLDQMKARNTTVIKFISLTRLHMKTCPLKISNIKISSCIIQSLSMPETQTKLTSLGTLKKWRKSLKKKNVSRSEN